MGKKRALIAVGAKEQIEAGKGRGSRTTGAQLLALVEWLQVEKNYDLITGAAQKKLGGVEAGVKLKKTDAYKELALFVNAKTDAGWTQKEGESRYRSVWKRYKDMKQAYQNVNGKKFGLSLKEQNEKITIEEKLEKMCHLYSM